MNWLRSSQDANGCITIHPPQPEYDQIPKCSQCGGLTQFLHFFPEVLPYLKDDDKVPSFCSGICGAQYIFIKQGRLTPTERREL